MTDQTSPRLLDRNDHVPALDGMRGMAVLMVLLYHFTLTDAAGPVAAVLRGGLRNFGWCGVEMFFVLSGFLITGILLEAKSAPRYFRNFYARRVLRIFPLYYAYLAIVWLIAPWAQAPGAKVRALGPQFLWYLGYLQNYLLAAAGDWTHSQLLNHLWSLAIEEQFYVFWPVVVLLCSRRILPGVCLALMATCLGLRWSCIEQGVPIISVYVLTPTRLDGLAVGAWLACAAREGGLRSWLWTARVVAPLSLGAVAWIAWQEGGFAYTRAPTVVWGLSALSLLFGSILVIAVEAPCGWLGRWFGMAWLRWFGRYSYGLYVLHQLVGAAVGGWLGRRSFSPLAQQALMYSLGFSASISLALVSWYCWERPFLRLKRFFPRGKPILD